MDSDRMDLDVFFINETPEFALAKSTVIIAAIRNEEQDFPPVSALAHLFDSEGNGIKQCRATVRDGGTQCVVNG